MSEREWVPPANYWIIETHTTRFIVPEDQAQKVIRAQEARELYVEAHGCYEDYNRLTVKSIDAIYPSSPDSRKSAAIMNEQFKIESKGYKEEYRKSLGLFDTDDD